MIKGSYVSGQNSPVRLIWAESICFGILRKVHCPFEEKGHSLPCYCSIIQTHPTICDPHGTVAHQALLSMDFLRQEYRVGCYFFSPGHLPKPDFLHCRQLLYHLSLRKPQFTLSPQQICIESKKEAFSNLQKKKKKIGLEIEIQNKHPFFISVTLL